MSFARKTITVTELTSLIKALLENEPLLASVSVVGEISGLTQSQRHVYFTLKDKDAQIRCAWFGRGGRALPFKDGDQVVASGRVTVYAPRGEYQLSVFEVVPKGLGELAVAYEKLKEKLKAEGLFDLDRKLPIPALPHSIAVVTSPTAAALQDMLNIHAKNAPHVELKLFASLVQGESAPGAIIAALSRAQADPRGFDILIVARGGGSIEDLWCFNDEALARALSQCTMPTISGVGHESDTTICDLVADMRAPTPTAAMEVATGNWPGVLSDLDLLANRIPSLSARFLADAARGFEQVADLRAVRAILGRIEDAELTLDDAAAACLSVSAGIDSLRVEAASAFDHRRIGYIVSAVAGLEESASRLGASLASLPARMANDRAGALSALSARVNACDMRTQLARGYSIVETAADGTIVTGPDEVASGDRISVRARDGSYIAVVDKRGEQARSSICRIS